MLTHSEQQLNILYGIFWEDIQGLWNEPDQVGFSYLVQKWHYLPQHMTHTVATDVSIVVSGSLYMDLTAQHN